MNEISLAFRTPKGAILVVGCSHPGIENIVEATTKIDPHIYTVFGGFHLLGTPDDKVTATIVAFRDKWRIERMAAGHCTGQFAFAELVRIYGPNSTSQVSARSFRCRFSARALSAKKTGLQPAEALGAHHAGRNRKAILSVAVHRLRLWQCAPTARNTSGGGFHPDSCRLVR